MGSDGGRRRAFSYLRLSSENQLKGTGLARQLEATRRYAAENDLDLAEGDELKDLGVSGFTGANVASGALGKFLDAIRAGKVESGSWLIVESLDRLSRAQPTKAVAIFLEIVNAGVTIVTLTDGHVYRPNNTEFMDLMWSVMIMTRAHEESATKIKRIRAAWVEKRKKASEKRMTVTCPSWLRPSRDGRTFEVIPERVAVVRSIFEDAAASIGTHAITTRLNRNGIKPFNRPRGNARPGWQRSYVGRILANRAVLGEMQPHVLVDGRRVPEGPAKVGYYPPIIDEGLFYRVQAGLAQRRNAPGRRGNNVTSLFSGMLYCAYCRSRASMKSKSGGQERYVICDTHRRGLECEGAWWRYRDLETSFLHFVHEVDIAAVMREEDSIARALDDEVEAIRGRIAEVQTKMDRVLELLDGATAVDMIRRKHNELDVARTRLEGELKAKVEERDSHATGHASIQDVKELIRRVQSSDEGEDTYKLRASVAARLRSIVDTVLLAPLGNAPSTRKAIEFLKEQEHPDAEAVIKHLEDTIFDERRYFVVVLKDGSMRAVFPDPEDPTRFSVQVTSSAEAGLVRHRPEGSEVVFPPAPSEEDVEELLRRVRNQP
jgi:DNA invertase Pin-like site-specific DNA recombinase